MAAPNANAKTTAPAVNSPSEIRNVVLIGASGAGKTTVIEGLLVATGAIGRAGSVADGTTVTDFDEESRRTQRSVGLALAPIVHDGVKINLIDAPGYADYAGDMRAALRAADAALFVISAVDGITGGTRMLWDECARLDKPRAVLITKLDNARADYDAVVEACHTHFGAFVLPMLVPLYKSEAEVGALMDLLSGVVIDHTSGTRTERAAQGEELGKLERNRDSLLQAIIQESNDEILLESYLEGDELDAKLLKQDLRKAVAAASFFPIMPMAAPGDIGTAELLNFLIAAFPSPENSWVPQATGADGTTYDLTAAADGPLLAEIIKTTTDSYLGRIAIVRMFSGSLTSDNQVAISGVSKRHGEEHIRQSNERVGALASPFGSVQRTIDRALAGDIVTVTRLASAETGDTLSDVACPLLVEPWKQPVPMYPVAISARRSQDEDKLSTSLARLVSEDPTLRLEHNGETGQMVLWSMGEAHGDVTTDQLKARFGVEVDRVEYKVPFRATLKRSVTVTGRHVKQSGGHGQYAVCELQVEPLGAGEGFEFVDKVVGGVVPRQFIGSVEKGVRAQMIAGVGGGYPLVDLRVTLLGGKAHSVDSSDAAFQTAGSIGLKEAAHTAGVALLEPILQVEITVDNEFVGTIMADLSGRRGRVSGTEAIDGGKTVVTAEVPEIEMVRYALDLRSMARGSGSFTRSECGYEAMPQHRADEVLSSR